MTPELEAGFRACRGVARRAASNFACMLSGCCRSTSGGGCRRCMPLPAAATTSPTARSRSMIRRTRLARWREQLRRALAGHADDPVLTALADTVSRFVVPQHLAVADSRRRGDGSEPRGLCDVCRPAAVLRARRVGGGAGVPGDLGLPRRRGDPAGGRLRRGAFSSRTSSATCRRMGGRGESICRTTSWPASASPRSIGSGRSARATCGELIQVSVPAGRGLFEAGLRTERYLDRGAEAGVSADVD